MERPQEDDQLLAVPQEPPDGEAEPVPGEVEPCEAPLLEHAKREAQAVPKDVEAVPDGEVE